MMRSSLLAELNVPHGFSGLGVPFPDDLIRPKQVHGTSIVEAASCSLEVEADGVIAVAPGIRIGIVTADCLPVLLANRDGAVVAALHAGWRGLTAGVIRFGVEAICNEGIDAEDIFAVVGVAIGERSFEVGPEVVEALAGAEFGLTTEQHAACVTSGAGDRSFVGLQKAARYSLLNLGLDSKNIEIIKGCTFSDSTWHSYRRDGPNAGRNLAWISCKLI